MNMQILVVTSDSRDMELLGPLARQSAGGEAPRHVFSFKVVDSIAQAMRTSAKAAPDLVLVNLDRQLHASALHPLDQLAVFFGSVPVIVLCGEGGTPAGSTLAAGHVVLDKAPLPLLAEMFRSVVAGARKLHASTVESVQRAALLEAIADAVISTDIGGNVRYLNSAAMSLAQVSPEEAVGQPIAQLMVLQDAVTLTPIPHPLLETLRTGRAKRVLAGSVLVRKDGSEIVIEDSTGLIVDADGAIGGAVMVFHDITEARELQAKVDYLAWHDYLTGLPNRFAAQRHLNRILREAATRGLPLAVMYLDLDRFKSVNDTLGHGAGDALLVSVAARLRSCFRMIDFVSRQGGDEFIVLMAPGASTAEAARAADRILASVALPHELEEGAAHVGCSIGIAMFPEHGTSGETLLRHADTALHGTKAAGRNHYRFFEAAMLSTAVQRRQLEDGMRRALAEGGFELHYQPKVRLSDGGLCGCEALLRWHHPEWGWVGPVEFIRSAEESGMIVPLGRWVLGEALRQARSWHAAGYGFGPIAVNVSALELRHGGFVEHVEEMLGASPLAPGSLQLELTESTLMRDLDHSIGVLLRLKGLGLSLAIDDFGTGYSSLGYLAELPVDVLKLDRSFVSGIDSAAPRRQALLQAVIVLAQRLALPTVAEGIETGMEAAFLSRAGCSHGQGFYYSHALEPVRFAQAYLGAQA